MIQWIYTISRGDWSPKVTFARIEDVLAYIYGREKLDGDYSAEYLIEKRKITIGTTAEA